MKKICVIGLGYIGLPTAAMFATHGMRVIGVDVNAHVVDVLNSGNIHIEEKGLHSLVQEVMVSGNLLVRQSPEPADAFIIAVPTPFNPDKTADMGAVKLATESIVPHLRKGNLVILESTSPPRTTVDLVRPILECSGLKAGADFNLAYSPERVLPGKILKELEENARVIGGIDRISAEAGQALYATFVKGKFVLTETITAEMVKLMENTFRDVNIALANEFALIAEKMKINVWDAIVIANLHPRVNILRPGPGVGGHCIAVDPWFLVEVAPEESRLIHQARLVNDGMPDHVVKKVKRIVVEIENPVIVCLGLTYKADVDDTRESPAVVIMKKLLALGYEVRVYDPHIKVLPTLGNHLIKSLEEAVNGADLLLLLVDHEEFKSLTTGALSGMRRKRVLDTRHCLDITTWQKAGFEIIILGNVE